MSLGDEQDGKTKSVQDWVEVLQYISLLDPHTLNQIHHNINNEFYEQPLLYDIILQSIIETNIEGNLTD